MEILEDKVHLWLQSAKFVKAKPGVYVLYNRSMEVIYIGGCDNLQNEFEGYVDTGFENDKCKRGTYAYQKKFVENPQEERRLLLEEYRKKHGAVPICNAAGLQPGQ